MNPVFEKVPRRQWESFHCEVIRGPDYGTRWHFHPECQITLAVRSEGHRVVGDHIAPLSDGDMVMVGANVPHVWRREDVAARIERLPGLAGLARVVALLDILDVLARSRELRPLASARYSPVLRHEDQDRMERVCDHIHKNLTGEIERGDLAQVAHLSEGAFSRFFRTRTGKTVPEYVNELRVGRACHMLAEERLNITDIALDCGFRNLANFNRRFREIVKMTPRDYRRRAVALRRRE
jgi:AraC-like DNA-binding protein